MPSDTSDPTDAPPPNVATDETDRGALEREPAPTDEGRSSLPSGSPRRRRMASLLFLVFGALVAVYLGTQGPKEQHVRIVLGPAASDVTSLDVRYVSDDGEVARSTHFTYAPGAAPRIVSHEPQLPNGEYRLEIDVDLADPAPDGAAPARDGRRTVQRQVTLGGGSTQVDVSTALTRADQAR